MAHAVSEEYRTLCRAFLTLRTEEEVGALLEDLCTIKEAEDMAQRLYVASLLDGGANYKQISEAIGLKPDCTMIESSLMAISFMVSA